MDILLGIPPTKIRPSHAWILNGISHWALNLGRESLHFRVKIRTKQLVTLELGNVSTNTYKRKTNTSSLSDCFARLSFQRAKMKFSIFLFLSFMCCSVCKTGVQQDGVDNSFSHASKGMFSFDQLFVFIILAAMWHQ